MDNMSTGDWFEDATFNDAVAYFNGQEHEPTTGPDLPCGAQIVSFAPSIGAAKGATLFPNSSSHGFRVLGSNARITANA